MIDRMANKSHLINMTGDSYRIMATKNINLAANKKRIYGQITYLIIYLFNW